MRDLEPAIELIEHFEGLVLHAYKDPVGIWTIGYGTTKGVKPGQVITKTQALDFLMKDLSERSGVIEDLIKVPVEDNEFCALLSFVYNVGNGAFAKSTLLRKLNSKRPRREVADEFLRWVRAGGKVLPGLVRRRKAERELFLSTQAAVDLA